MFFSCEFGAVVELRKKKDRRKNKSKAYLYRVADECPLVEEQEHEMLTTEHAIYI